MELVTGASGYVGTRLVRRLLREDRPVRALVRDVASAPDDAEVVHGDLLTGVGVDAALDGCSTAYYLIHSMEPVDGDLSDFAERDRRAAEAFGAAARAAGVERIVYLGGLAPPPGQAPSPHLASRLEVERILLAAVPGSTALRASILVGACSSSFRILVRLIERLPVLPLPGWRDRRTQPIDERDAVEYLARTPATPAAAGRSLDIAGPDTLTYGEIVHGIAELMGVARPRLGAVPSAPPVASAVVAAVTEQPLELVRPLMESLEHDLLPRDDEAARLFGLRLRGFERAVERALAEWERSEPLAAR